MGKSYKRLSADVKSADVLSSAIMHLKYQGRIANPAKVLKSRLSEFSNSAEISRIVKYLTADRVIIKDGKEFRWHGEVPVWDNVDKRRTYCLQMLHHSREDMPEIILKNGNRSNHPKRTASVPKQEESPKGILFTPGTLDLTSHSDDELTAIMSAIQKEFDARSRRREKLARLQQVLELAEMSKEELIDLLETK